MKVETVLNGAISLIIIPETDLDVEVLKQILKQESDITHMGSQLVIMNKPYKGGLIISKKGSQGALAEDKEDGK